MPSPKHSPQSNQTSKWVTFLGMYMGYTLAIVNRKCFSFALPAIMTSLKLDKNEAGLISSSQNLAYTISKFVGGILCDTINVKYLFCFGLFGSGLLTISLSAFRTAGSFAVILFLQGISQGGAWPACAKILKGMFTSSEFCTWYSILNTGMNVACCIGPIMVAYVIAFYSWPSVFLVSGIAAVLGSLLSYWMIQWPTTSVDANKKGTENNEMKGRGSWKDIMRSPFMWVVSVSYLVTFMGRTAALDWGQLYIIQELKHSPYVGSLFITSMEIGGVIGSVVSGYAADRLVSRCQKNSINGTPRMTVATVFVLIFTMALHVLLFCVSSGTSEFLIFLVGFLMGFGIYGPISIYGVMSIEASPIHLQGTSHAIVSLAANIGAITAGFPFSLVAQYWNWRGAFITMEVILIGTILMKVVTRNVEYKMVPTKKKLQ